MPSDATHIHGPGNLLTLGNNTPSQTNEFGMTVIQGLVLLDLGNQMSVSYTWTVPHAAVQTGGSGWLYQYAIQKQAGMISRPIDVTLTLPSCAHVYGKLQGFTTPTAGSAVYKQPDLTSDTTLSLQYTC